jgi:uncharacterized protein involved in response to NO
MQANPMRHESPSRFVVFAYGFRPFFLLVGIWAIVPMGTIVWASKSGRWPVDAMPLFTWHGHEMLFGFVAAAIAGFLLTAVPTWTGIRAISGIRLILLVVLWGAGRIAGAPWMQMPDTFVQLLGIAFFPALALTVAVPLVRTKNTRNLPFLVFLTLLFIADLAYQAPRLGWADNAPFDGLRLALNTVVLLIVIVGGRIVPAFTRNALVQLGRPVAIRSFLALDVIAIGAVAGVLFGDLFARNSDVAGVLAGLASIFLAARLGLWNGWRTRDIPLLWVLHLGYSWIVVGLALKALWLLGDFAWAMNWMHALTAGGFGTMILGVMTRVALGHTGRPLIVSRYVAASYLLITAAAALRVWGPWLVPGQYLQVLAASVVAWIAGFALFLLLYTPILVRPRVDGKAG